MRSVERSLERSVKRLVGAVFLLSLLMGSSVFLSSCTKRRADVGTEKNPIKLFFTPSVDAKIIEDNSALFKSFLESKTGYKFEVGIPQSYIAVVESFGTKRADVAIMSTFGYILAHEKYGVQARMTVLRHGRSTYQSQFIVRADGPIKTLSDMNGKKMAFVDSSSTTGYLLPLKTFKDRGIKPSEVVFAQKHDNVVSMVYQGQVDGGATFFNPPAKGEIQDARRLVLTQYPDVEKKVKILEYSESIPNDPIIFRKDLPEEIKKKIEEAFIQFVSTPEGQKAFENIYSVTGLLKCQDSDYDTVRSVLTTLGKKATELMPSK